MSVTPKKLWKERWIYTAGLRLRGRHGLNRKKSYYNEVLNATTAKAGWWTAEKEGAPTLVTSHTLFCGPDVDLREGDKLS